MTLGQEVSIVPYRDGPYLVRGPVNLRDQQGNEISLARTPVALCRCGRSRVRPFCDGTHRTMRFVAPSELEADATSGSQLRAESLVDSRDDLDATCSAQAQAIRAELLRAAKLTEIALQVGTRGSAAEVGPAAAAAALREVARQLEAIAIDRQLKIVDDPR